MQIVIYIAIFLVSAIIFTFVGMAIRKKVAESKLGSAEEEARKIINLAQKEAENKKKEEIFKAKEEIMNSRKDLDNEIRERRSEVQQQERRLLQKEENLENKMEHIERKEQEIENKKQELENKKQEISKTLDKQMQELQRISGLSKEEAKNQLLADMDKQLTLEKANLIKNAENKVKEESIKNAREVIGYAIQKCAADHTAETTVSIVPLPNDEMKGRIIGREGRNIRTLETLTGVDLIIDDTPEAVVISGFDALRREIARIALEKLMEDGRIHPAKIEEMVEKAKEEVAETIKEEGERACMETGVIGLHPDIVNLLGKLKYRTSYDQNVLNHSIEVSNLARIMADELGLDPKLSRREVARIALEKLMEDGRIHPAKIEEMVEKAKEEVAETIKEEGERACMETGVIGLHPDLVNLLGKLKYRTSYGQNVLNHSIEVSNLARIMADELGLDPKLARRAGLLHDIGKALDHDVEGTHVQIGVDVLKKYKENPIVINAVEAHHGDVEPQTVEAVLVAAADAISASRPGARRETLENYIKRLEKLESIADSFKGVEKSFAIQAGREVRIVVKPEQITDADMTILARDVAKKVEEEMEYPGQIKVNIIRETRVVDYAK